MYRLSDRAALLSVPSALRPAADRTDLCVTDRVARVRMLSSLPVQLALTSPWSTTRRVRRRASQKLSGTARRRLLISVRSTPHTPRVSRAAPLASRALPLLIDRHVLVRRLQWRRRQDGSEIQGAGRQRQRPPGESSGIPSAPSRLPLYRGLTPAAPMLAGQHRGRYRRVRGIQ
jgi:hypothetical protein